MYTVGVNSQSPQPRHILDLDGTQAQPSPTSRLVFEPPKQHKRRRKSDQPRQKYTLLLDLECSPEDLSTLFLGIEMSLLEVLSRLANERNIEFSLSNLRVPKNPPAL